MARNLANGSILTCVVLSFTSVSSAQWVKFNNESATRVSASAANGSNDVDEKDFAWGDVDKDGDIDLVSVRKEPFTSPGKRTNVLYMNEGGVLTDRTSQYATATDVAGDNGFLTATNDRDVLLVDLDGDTWLDIVTATTLSDGDTKAIGHPRIYRNLGEIAGVWQGFRYEVARIPTMTSVAGQAGNPRFCSVAAGDITGDGFPELWFGDYDSAGVGGQAEAPGQDFDDRLLLNDGNGFFTDVTNGAGTRFSGTITVTGTPYPFRQSAFGAAAAIADMNGDGKLDIVKQTALNPPQYVGIGYNKSTQQGFFEQYQVVNQQAPYFFSVGDLNNDGRNDIVVSDDGTDTYLLNTGNAANGSANFTTLTFPAATGGFGAQSVIADLNNDGWNDVLISDVDVDIPPCDSRQADILRNNGNAPNVTFAADSGNIAGSNLVGVHNFAVFDINGDGWLDVVAGRCNTLAVWINDPPIGIQFTYPNGLPATPQPNTPTPFQVQATPIGATALAPNSGVLHYRINAGTWSSQPMVDTATPGIYDAVLPGAPCASQIQYYVEAALSGGAVFTGPSGAPVAGVNVAVPAYGTQITLTDFETDTGGFTVSNTALTAGAWERAIPNGTINGSEVAAPSADAEAATSQVYCFVTQNGAAGGGAGAADVDGGPTDLTSPAIDLAGSDATISYAVWFYSSVGGTSVPDSLIVSVSNDNGLNWTTVETITTTNSTWQNHSFVVSDYFPGIPLTANVRVRFRASDNPNNSVTEAGMDVFQVTKIDCTPPVTCICSADINADGQRTGLDIQGFIECAVNGAGANCACADLDGTAGLQPTDTALFVDAVLLGGPCEP